MPFTPEAARQNFPALNQTVNNQPVLFFLTVPAALKFRR